MDRGAAGLAVDCRAAHTSPLYSMSLWIALAGLIAVLAHMYPVWLRFHGGKGVATGTGAFLALNPTAVAAGVLVFLIVILATRFVYLASILSAASIPLFFSASWFMRRSGRSSSAP